MFLEDSFFGSQVRLHVKCFLIQYFGRNSEKSWTSSRARGHLSCIDLRSYKYVFNGYKRIPSF